MLHSDENQLLKLEKIVTFFLISSQSAARSLYLENISKIPKKFKLIFKVPHYMYKV